MNIFFLSGSPAICATYHCDKHVVKMVTEYAQLLSVAHRMLDGFGKKGVLPGEDPENPVLYRMTHSNHPCAVWVRHSSGNYMFLAELYHHLANEYTHRYSRQHAAYVKNHHLLLSLPRNISHGFMTIPPICMPDEIRNRFRYIHGLAFNTVDAYRELYRHKSGSGMKMKYTNREIPSFLPH